MIYYKFTPSDEGANQNKMPCNHNKKLPVKLDKKTLDLLLSCLSPKGNQARRMLNQVGLNPDSETNRINKNGGVNLSAVANYQINPKIQIHGYSVKCRHPPSPIINAFGEKSGQELWGVCKL